MKKSFVLIGVIVVCILAVLLTVLAVFVYRSRTKATTIPISIRNTTVKTIMNVTISNIQSLFNSTSTLKFTSVVSSGTTTANRPSYWVLDESLVRERSDFGSALLTNDRIIISGGYMSYNSGSSISEIYSSSAIWKLTSYMNGIRTYFTLTSFANNTKVLATGSFYTSDQRTAEVYDSTTNMWTPTANNMSYSRYYHTATLLGNGQILIIGGRINVNITLSTAEIYDPSSNSFIQTNNMTLARRTPVSILLSDRSTVLVIGGIDPFNYLTETAELYINGSWIYTNNNMTQFRNNHAAVLLQDGNVLVAGGGNGGSKSYSSAEIYNATTRTFRTVGSMKYARSSFTLTLLPSGKVLATGGIDWSTNTYIQVCELYDPLTKIWSDTRSINIGRSVHQTVLLNNFVLTFGGRTGIARNQTDTCEKYML